MVFFLCLKIIYLVFLMCIEDLLAISHVDTFSSSVFKVLLKLS